MPPPTTAPRRLSHRVETIVALLALLIASAVGVYAVAELQCQRRLNAVAADEAKAMGDLVDAIFIADQIEEQMSAYETYIAARNDLEQRRAAEGCSW